MEISTRFNNINRIFICIIGTFTIINLLIYAICQNTPYAYVPLTLFVFFRKSFSSFPIVLQVFLVIILIVCGLLVLYMVRRLFGRVNIEKHSKIYYVLDWISFGYLIFDTILALVCLIYDIRYIDASSRKTRISNDYGQNWNPVISIIENIVFIVFILLVHFYDKREDKEIAESQLKHKTSVQNT